MFRKTVRYVTVFSFEEKVKKYIEKKKYIIFQKWIVP